jgi:hypothetical protein
MIVAERYHATCNQLNALIEIEQKPVDGEPKWFEFWKVYF